MTHTPAQNAAARARVGRQEGPARRLRASSPSSASPSPAPGLWVLDVARRGARHRHAASPPRAARTRRSSPPTAPASATSRATILRTPVGLDEIPETLQQATIAIEDEHFYEHCGRRLRRDRPRGGREHRGRRGQAGCLDDHPAAGPQPLHRRPRGHDRAQDHRGGDGDAVRGRVHEGPDPQAYLNTASYGTNDGRTAVGVQAASQVFFNKDVEDINLGEAALLAGLPQAPTDYNPFTNPKGAKHRRNEVLDAMAEQGYITLAEAEHDEGDGRSGSSAATSYESRSQQYFFDFVQQELIDKYGARDRRARAGSRSIRRSTRTCSRSPRTRSPPTRSTGAAEALVSTDVDTGEIIAMASSESYEDSQFNLAAQGRRQPGSSFKPYALTAAVDQGYRPGLDLLPGAEHRSRIRQGAVRRGLGRQRRRRRHDQPPRGDGELGQHRLRPARHRHRPRDDGRHGEADGRHQPARPGFPADVLGASDVTVLDQSNGFATIANGGVHHDPTAIARVVFPDGDVDEPPKEPEGNRVISDGVAYTVADVMKGTLDYGTAAGHGHRLPGGRQDRDHRGAGRRLVRRLHAARLDRGLGRQPERARRRCPATAPTSRRRSGTTT